MIEFISMHNHRTKIVCTIGPASESLDRLRQLVTAGMNVVRLNFSHGTHDDHLAVINRIRLLEREMETPIAILQDLQGPKIRVGRLPEAGIDLTPHQMVIFDTGISALTRGRIPVDYKLLHKFLKPGERLLLDDGRVETKIVAVKGKKIQVEVVVGGHITSHKGINVPDSHLAVRALTDKDKDDLLFGVAHEVDLIALSFVMSKKDILDARAVIAKAEKKFRKQKLPPIGIIAKIERGEAVKNMDDILSVVDGIMVARGDLGVETPAADVPIVQKTLIAHARTLGKPVIVATQMLDSMQHSPRPTRAEVSDVANAVIDHADAIMLSNESATGEYPIEAVSMMAEIAHDTEASAFDNVSIQETRPISSKDLAEEDRLGELARRLSAEKSVKAIVIMGQEPLLARLVSRYRPELPIIAVTADERVARQLQLVWGVMPLVAHVTDMASLCHTAFAFLASKKIAHAGDNVVVVADASFGKGGEMIIETKKIS